MALLELSNITRDFGPPSNRVHVLRDINLSIDQGDFISIIGQSGSGKTTLMNILGCLDAPTSGSCLIDGEEAAGRNPDQLAALRRRKFGFIFQRYNLLGTLSAKDNVALPAIYAGVKKSQRSRRAEDLLKQLALTGKENNRPGTLSGGQQQRVSIARALMNGGEIILADEPTGALDSESGLMVMDILTQLHAKGHTIILVTHDRKLAAFASRTIELKDGEIISDTRRLPLSSPVPLEGVEEKHGITFYADQLAESFRMSLQAIISHKLRSLLTMLGIIIGIASVVSVVAIGKGSQEKILSRIKEIGTNTISVYPGKSWGDSRSGRIRTLTINDAKALGKQPFVLNITPRTSTNGNISYRNITLTSQLNGVGEQFFSVDGLELEGGRFFNETDVKEDNQVVVIDSNTKKELFSDMPLPQVLGRTILFNKRPLVIIGVTEEPTNAFGPDSGQLRMWAPYTTVMHQITGDKVIGTITAEIADNVNSQAAEETITRLLTSRHGTQDFFTMNSDSIKETITATTGTMTLLISAIAVISLIVGGIGVMNIMLVSVTERTGEIGLRMAIGARQGNILQQFLIEAILICLAGGIFGVGLSVVIALLFNHFVTDFAMTFSTTAIVAAVLCSTAIGIIFGFIPARNAARLSPIEALTQK